MTDYLGLQGFAVRTAASAAELDARLAEAPADLIVLDVNMPGETGLEALARLRRQGLDRRGDHADRRGRARRDGSTGSATAPTTMW